MFGQQNHQNAQFHFNFRYTASRTHFCLKDDLFRILSGNTVVHRVEGPWGSLGGAGQRLEAIRLVPVGSGTVFPCGGGGQSRSPRTTSQGVLVLIPGNCDTLPYVAKEAVSL